ncbi:MAG: hypothetical protein KGH65_00785 [Candidatus Micrarchaeota archaeon]|nr:hypothetical protein [Candidatus Micrarchaeota archaeon]
MNSYALLIQCDSKEVIPDVEKKLSLAGFTDILRIDDKRKTHDIEVEIRAPSSNAALLIKKDVERDSNHMIRSIAIALR